MGNKILSLILTMLILVSMLAVSFDVGADEVIYPFNYTFRNGTVTITKANSSLSGNVTIPSSINGYPVTNIGNGAFSSCSGLTGIEIPNSVTNIGNYAFFSCIGLTSIDIPSSVTSVGNYAFSYCDGLTSLEIPGSMTNIAAWAFSSCNSLMSVKILDGVTNVGDYAFYYCTSLLRLEIAGSVTTIGESAFAESELLANVEIPEGVVSIGNEAFYRCADLTSVKIPASVTSIGSGAFSDCEDLSSITVDEGNPAYTDVDGNLFSKDEKEFIQYAAGKTNTSFIIPNSVTSIGNSAFSGCKSLIEVEIPEGVTSIGERIFDNCYNLASITVDERNTTFKDLDGNLYSKDGNKLILYTRGKTDTSFVIPNSVASIGDNAFALCDMLMSIEIPNSVTSIGESAFSGCGITSIKIPTNVTSIEDWVFSYCRSLTSVEIPNSVTSIGEYAFFSCNSLTDVYYGGSEDEWGAIMIDLNNTCLTDATIHYNYHAESESGITVTYENEAVTVSVSKVSFDEDSAMYVGLYDDDTLIAIKSVNVSANQECGDVVLEKALEEDKEYDVKLMFWNIQSNPLTEAQSAKVHK